MGSTVKALTSTRWRLKWWWMQVRCWTFANYCWHCDQCKTMFQVNELDALKRIVSDHLDVHRLRSQVHSTLAPYQNGCRWLNRTDLLVRDAEEPKDRLILRQVGWQGHTGRFYAMGERVSDTEPGGYGPVYRFLDD